MLRTGGKQANRIIRVDTPLGPDVLLLNHFSGHEQLSQLFEFHLDLLADTPDIAIDDLLGQNVTVSYKLPIGGTRYFNGFVSEFGYVGSQGEYAHYQATLRPWYWLMTRTSDSRIFQFMKAPDIIQAVFADNGFSDFEVRLFGDYREWEYCVQYRETDYNFLARLMEQEGIYYYFKHEAGKHTLVLADSISSHDPYPGYASAVFHASTQSVLKEHIRDWRVGKRIQPGKVVLNDFNFKTPRADLKANRPMPRPHAHAKHEIYDYPGEYNNKGEGESYARIRLEELQASHTLMHGQGNVGGIAPGFLISLEKHARQDQNQEYRVLQADYTLHSEDYESGGGGDEGTSFDVAFSVMPASEPYRPPRITPKPIVQGPQTAIVTGPPGEEIYPDQYGRVKVQFHWDRYGQRNENSSCWIRVSQPWAGKGWGGMSIPRIGQEVIVDFIEGDPDQPIITGRVYNADSMPPYGLPANKTRMTIKSKTHKGVGSNEMRFDDDNGKEEIYIHAQKDQNNVVENDETTHVKHDRTEHVDNNETITIGVDRTESVGNNETIAIGVNRSETVGNNETIAIGVNRDETVGSNESVSIGSNQSLRVGSDQSIDVGSSQSISVGKNQTETVSIAKAVSVGAGFQISVGGLMNTTVGVSSSEEVGLIKTILAGSKISLICGGASITLHSGGKIEIEGSEILMSASGPVKINGKVVDIN